MTMYVAQDSADFSMPQTVSPTMPPGVFAHLRYATPLLGSDMQAQAGVAWRASASPPAPPQKPAGERRQREKRQPASKVQVLSRGSKNHSTGQCRPCRAITTPEGCVNGQACNYCHHAHEESRLVEAALFSVKKGLERTAKVVGGASASDDVWFVESEHSTSAGSSSRSSSSSGPQPHQMDNYGEPKYVFINTGPTYTVTL